MSEPHEHDGSGCYDCECWAAPPNTLPCTCPPHVASDLASRRNVSATKLSRLTRLLMVHTDETCHEADCGSGFGYHDTDTRDERRRGCEHLAAVLLAELEAGRMTE